MKRSRYILALAIVLSCPAAADTLADYDVYATGQAAIAGGSYGAIASNTFINANGPMGTNFSSWSSSSAALTADALALSLALKSQTSTGMLTSDIYTPGAGTLTGTSSGINVFNLTSTQYNSLYSLVFAGPGNGAIINVSGPSASGFVNMDFGSLLAQYVVFNFFDASSVSMAGMNIRGTILAPNATVSLGGGTVAGDVISDDFSSAGTIIGGVGFTGLAVPPLVPEPASWDMMIVGFAALGALLRQRRAELGRRRPA